MLVSLGQYSILILITIEHQHKYELKQSNSLLSWALCK